tara:strand:+ start:5689 stop:6057 length:369 start_codon:yes stop_codon:yes gene_type:complete
MLPEWPDTAKMAGILLAQQVEADIAQRPANRRGRHDHRQLADILRPDEGGDPDQGHPHEGDEFEKGQHEDQRRDPLRMVGGKADQLGSNLVHGHQSVSANIRARPGFVSVRNGPASSGRPRP